MFLYYFLWYVRVQALHRLQVLSLRSSWINWAWSNQERWHLRVQARCLCASVGWHRTTCRWTLWPIMCTFTFPTYSSWWLYCGAVFYSVLPGAIVPLMKDPLKVLNYDTWWRKDLNNILPYVIPAVNDDITQKMEVQLEDSSNRIHNTRSNGGAIVQHLQCLIDEGKCAHTFPFSWNLKFVQGSSQKSLH